MFSNILLVFLVSLQLGSYQMMIDGSLAAFPGHIQIQHRGYLQDQHIYQSVPAAVELAARVRSDAGYRGRGGRARRSRWPPVRSAPSVSCSLGAARL